MIERIRSADNKKHIEIVLLAKTEQIIEAGMQAQKQFANNVLSGLTEEEKHICISVFRKICNNADMLLKKNMELDRKGERSMREKNDKPQMPDVMEAIFDAAYLIFDRIAGILFFVFLWQLQRNKFDRSSRKTTLIASQIYTRF